MPPKNKKQLEEEAKRLQQERLKKEEQERLLQQERKKYAAETLITGLVLPVSNQLLSDFTIHQSSFINEKLKQVLAKQYPQLKDEKVSKQILKEMFFHIKNSISLFNLNQKSTFQSSKEQFLKVRVCCGIFLTLFLDTNPSLTKNIQKNKQSDEKLFRTLLLSHGQSRGENQQKVFEKKQILKVLGYFKEFYFDHFLVLHRWSNFIKRQDQKSFNLYIATPNVEFNDIHTKFVDLSTNKNEAAKSDQNEKKIQ